MSKDISNRIPYLVTIISFLLAILLPTFTAKTYDLGINGEVITKSSEPLTIFSRGFLQNMGLISLVFLIFGIIFTVFAMIKGERKRLFIRLSILSAISSILAVDIYRQKLIDDSYAAHTNYANIIPFSFGFYFQWIAILFLFIALRLPDFESNEEFKEYVKEISKSKSKNIINSTTTVYIAIHILSLIAMYISYGAYFGFGKVLEAPAYYQKAMLTYGLNYDETIPEFWNYIAIFTAPMIVILLGVSLFTLRTSGFAPNGPDIKNTAPETSLYLGEGRDFDIWGYFSMDIPFAEKYAFNFKLNFFYFFIIILPLLIGPIIAGLYNYYKLNKASSGFKQHMTIVAVSAFIFSIIFSNLSAPVYISLWGLLKSLIIDRRTNYFIRYRWVSYEFLDNGNYHPMSIFNYMVLVWIPILIYFVVINNFIKAWINGELKEKKESKQVMGKYYDEAEQDLPFEKE